jgi:hypothetical protein
MADSIAQLFAYNHMEHFMLSRNLDFQNDEQYREAKALLLSWRVEALGHGGDIQVPENMDHRSMRSKRWH